MSERTSKALLSIEALLFPWPVPLSCGLFLVRMDGAADGAELAAVPT